MAGTSYPDHIGGEPAKPSSLGPTRAASHGAVAPKTMQKDLIAGPTDARDFGSTWKRCVLYGLPRRPATACAVVEALRRQRYTGKEIAGEVGISAASVSRILHGLGLNRLAALEPAEPIRRYEHEHPGEQIYIQNACRRLGLKHIRTKP